MGLLRRHAGPHERRFRHAPLAWLLASGLAAHASAWPQTESAAMEPFTQDELSAEQVPDFGALGDLWGVRSDLSAAGIDFGGTLTVDNAWNTMGGLSRGFVFLPLLDLNLALRTKPLIDLEGGRFNVAMIAYGQSRNPDALVPDFWGWSDLISGIGSVTQLSELWYEQILWDDRLRIRFGKQDANALFAVTPGAANFITSAADYPGPLVGYLPTYPEQAVGLAIEVEPIDRVIGRFGWFDGTTNYFDVERGTRWPNTGTRGPKSFFNNPGSWFFITEAEVGWRLYDDLLPGMIQAGAWWQTGTVGFLPPSVSSSKSGGEGLDEGDALWSPYLT